MKTTNLSLTSESLISCHLGFAIQVKVFARGPQERPRAPYEKLRFRRLTLVLAPSTFLLLLICGRLI